MIESAQLREVPGSSPRGADALRLPHRLRALGAFWGLTLAVVVGYLLAPDLHGRRILFVVSHTLSIGAFAVGVAMARGVFRRDWGLMLLAVSVWGFYELLRALDGLLPGDSWWQAGSALSLVASVLMMIGTVRLARRDGLVRYASIRVDAAIYIIATALVWWLLCLRHLVNRPDLVDTGTVVASLLPLGDAVMLVGAAALAASRSAHALSSRALVLYCAVGLSGDLVFAHQVLTDSTVLTRWAPTLWMFQVAFGATAALSSGRARTTLRTRMSLLSSVLVMVAAVAPLLLALWIAYAVGSERFASAGPVSPTATPIHARTVVIVAVGTAVCSALVVVRARRLVAQIEEQALRLEHLARTDELTQVANRRAGERILGGAIASADAARPEAVPAGDGPTVQLAMLDLDHFKQFNDSYGHQQGDELLRTAAQAWKGAIDGRATLFRYGGEEFGVIFRDATVRDAEALLDELQQVTPFGQSFSGGLATLRPGDDAASLVGRADAALYAAKGAGRARTVREG